MYNLLIKVNMSHELGELKVFMALINNISELSMKFVLTMDA